MRTDIYIQLENGKTMICCDDTLNISRWNPEVGVEHQREFYCDGLAYNKLKEYYINKGKIIQESDVNWSKC